MSKVKKTMTYTYQQVHLFLPTAQLSTEPPQGLLELQYNASGCEISLRDITLPPLAPLTLYCETIQGQRYKLGYFRPVGAEHAKLLVKGSLIDPLRECSKLELYDHPEANGGKGRHLLTGFMNCPVEEESPRDYLWEQGTKDFPQLLEQMLEKVEAINEKINTLEQRRSGNALPAISKVEPFQPPLGKYKWWKLGY